MTWIALTIVLAVGGGAAFARNDKAHADQTARALLRVIIYVIVPPVAFLNVTRLDVGAGIGVQVVTGWLALALTGAVGYLIGTRVLGLDRPTAGAFTNAGLAGNTTYLGLPAVAVLFGHQALGQAIVYNQLVAGPTLYLGVFGLGAALGTRGGKGWRQRTRSFITRNPPLVAVLAALAAPSSLAPDALVSASHVLVFACLPLGFFAVGVTLAGENEHGRLRFSSSLTPSVATALLVRLIVGPLLLLAVSAPLIDLPTSYLVLAAMPVAVNTLAVAHEYGLDHRLAASTIAWSTSVFLLVTFACSLYAAYGWAALSLVVLAIGILATTGLAKHSALLPELARRSGRPRVAIPTRSDRAANRTIGWTPHIAARTPDHRRLPDVLTAHHVSHERATRSPAPVPDYAQPASPPAIPILREEAVQQS